MTRWADVLDYCIGEVGLKPDEFWRMTWKEVETACNGYQVRLARSREMDRFIAAVLINANRKKGAAAVRPEDIMPLVTDKPAKVVPLMTKEEYEKAIELSKSIKWQNQNLMRS